MGPATRFEDLTTEEKEAFLLEARARHSDLDPTGPAFTLRSPRWSLAWGCGDCGWGYPIEDVLVAYGEPQCPRCDALGWFRVIPRG